MILVGEIRDADTARIAIQSALTGHFVLSSLHGTDSVSAVHRLLDMGIEAFLVASAIVGVVSQRLLRRICDNCKEPYTPTRRRARRVPPALRRQRQDQFFHGNGCSYCANTGYRDRIGVYELLRITPELRRLIVGWATTEELRRLAVAQGMRTMLREAMQLVEDDVTTIPEVVRDPVRQLTRRNRPRCPRFAYAAIDATGAEIEGTTKADTIGTARARSWSSRTCSRSEDRGTPWACSTSSSPRRR